MTTVPRRLPFRFSRVSETSHLLRVHCYFDDVASNELGCMNEYVGELLAIKEFNETFKDRKVCKIEQLRICRPRWENWQDRMYAFHNFSPSGIQYFGSFPERRKIVNCRYDDWCTLLSDNMD